MVAVLQLIETGGPGGAEQVVIALAKSYAADGRSFVNLLKGGWLADRLKEERINVAIHPLTRSLDPRWFRHMLAQVKRNSIEVIHSHEFSMNIHATLLGLMSGLPVVCTVHGKNYYGDRWYRRLAYRLLSKYSHFAAVSEDIAEYLNTDIGVASGRISVVKNGIDIGKFSENCELRSQVRKELGLSDSDCVIGAIGNLYPVKGHIYLLQAMDILCSKYDRLKLVVAGRGGEKERLERYIIENGLEDRVSLLGFRNDAARLLQALDIYVMPSLSEGLPLSLLEAMASGTPVVASSVGGIPELLTDRLDGLLVASASAEAVAGAISALIEQPDLGARLAESAYQLVVEDYSTLSMRSSYNELFGLDCD